MPVNTPAQALLRFAVMGHPVTHNKSPLIYSQFAAQFGHHIEYRAIDVAPGSIGEALRRFQRGGGKGLNVAPPHKLDVFRFASHVSPRATLAGAVNVLKFDDDAIFGDNTEGAGLVRDLTQNLAVALKDADILVLGAGAAARSVLGPLLDQHPASLTVVNRTVLKAKDLADLFSTQGTLLSGGFNVLAGRRFDIVINATAANVVAKVVPLPDGIFNSGALAYDLTYGDRPTAFTDWARVHGATTAADGLGMLVEQAAECYCAWLGVRPDTRPVIAALRQLS